MSFPIGLHIVCDVSTNCIWKKKDLYIYATGWCYEMKKESESIVRRAKFITDRLLRKIRYK